MHACLRFAYDGPVLDTLRCLDCCMTLLSSHVDLSKDNAMVLSTKTCRARQHNAMVHSTAARMEPGNKMRTQHLQRTGRCIKSLPNPSPSFTCPHNPGYAHTCTHACTHTHLTRIHTCSTLASARTNCELASTSCQGGRCRTENKSAGVLPGFMSTASRSTLGALPGSQARNKCLGNP